jgi:Lon protease-like protein
VLNLHVFEPRYKQMISECLQVGDPFGVVLIREGDEAGDPQATPYEIGTTAEIADVTPLEQGRYYISTVGGRRFRIEKIVSREPYLTGEVSYLPEDDLADEAALRPLMQQIHVEFAEYLRLLVEFSGMQAEADLDRNPTKVSFVIGDALQVADAMKQQLLELSNTEDRLTAELGFLKRLLPQLRALLERKREARTVEAHQAGGGAFRTAQEKFFGKHFSVN